MAIWATPMRLTATVRATPGISISLSGRPAQLGADRALDHRHPGAGVDPVVGLGGVGDELAQHPVDRPLDRGDRGDAEALVDDRPAGVVDAGHDPLDAEGLAGHPGGEDVGVVAVGDGGDGGGLADAGLLEPVAVEPDPDDLPAAEPLVEPAEGDVGPCRRRRRSGPRPR